MTIGLSQGVAVTSVALTAQAIGCDDLLEQVRHMAGKPRVKGGTDVKAQRGVVVDNRRDAAAVPE